MGVLKVRDGSGNWVPVGVGNPPDTAGRGVVGRTVGTTSAFTTTSATAVAITVTAGQPPTLTLALDPTRLYRASFWTVLQTSAVTDRYYLELFAGGTFIRQLRFGYADVANVNESISAAVVFQPSASTPVAYGMFARIGGGLTLNLSGTNPQAPIEFVIEDIGKAA